MKDPHETYSMRGQFNRVSNNIQTWREKKGFHSGWDNVPEKLMLTVTELSEAMEVYRHIQFTEEATPRPINWPQKDAAENGAYIENFEEELADTVIRIMDLATACGLDLEAAIEKKMAKNEGRPHMHGKNC